MSHKNGNSMEAKDDLRSEYPANLIKQGVRGKYAKRMSQNCVTVSIDPELSKDFPTTEAVNDALRELLRRRSADAHR
jgi:hypothetical protein